MGQKLPNAPLYFVLGQVKYSAIPNFNSVIPTVVKNLQAKYPDYRRDEIREILLKLDGTEEIKGPHADTIMHRHFVAALDKSSGFLIEETGLSYFTTVYGNFEEFIEEIKFGLEAVSKDGMIGASHRVGIRYINGVFTDKQDLASLLTMVDKSLFGISEVLAGDLTGSYSETHKKFDNCNVALRIMMRRGILGLPADLNLGQANVLERFQGDKGIHAVLDIDSWSEKPEVFNLKGIEQTLTKLHDEGIEPVFDAITTAHAKTIWRKK